MKKFLGFYLFIASISSIYMWQFGEYSYKTYAYNFGRALTWPLQMFKDYPRIDGSSAENFAASYNAVIRSHPNDSKGNSLFSESVGYKVLKIYFEKNPSLAPNSILELERGEQVNMAKLINTAVETGLLAATAEEFDGMTLGDIADNRDQYREELSVIIEQAKENRQSIATQENP